MAMSEQTLLTTAAAPGAVFAFQPSQRYLDPRITRTEYDEASRCWPTAWTAST